MLPPILEVYVVWHRNDESGHQVASEIFEHFHGTAYSGLIGGAIEVYVRSPGWRSADDAPRPIPIEKGSLPAGIPAARYVVVVPLLGLGLAKAVQPGAGAWHEYLTSVLLSQTRAPDRIGVFPYQIDPSATDGTRLGTLLGKFQRIAATPPDGEGETQQTLRCRDLAQGIAQLLLSGTDKRLTVFVSHTKRSSPRARENIETLIASVREVIRNTRLREFFDESDLQVGRDWSEELEKAAATSALLAVRTDMYSSRAWCQREMLVAKRAGMPVVVMDAISEGEERGSFLMDHVPRTPSRTLDGHWVRADIRHTLNLLVDECLKRVLWLRQRELAETEAIPFEIAWWAPHAPEPLTLSKWLMEQKSKGNLPAGAKSDLIILHPDPPLGNDEVLVLNELAKLSGLSGKLDIVTPRLLAARGG